MKYQGLLFGILFGIVELELSVLKYLDLSSWTTADLWLWFVIIVLVIIADLRLSFLLL